MLRFHREAVAALARGELAGLGIGDYVAVRGYSKDFVDGFLLPAIGTVCTCTLAQAREFPVEVIVDYLARGVARQSVHRALHGADDVQRRLLTGIADLRCNINLTQIVRVPAGRVRLVLADGNTAHFDQVVLATQAN